MTELDDKMLLAIQKTAEMCIDNDKAMMMVIRELTDQVIELNKRMKHLEAVRRYI